MSLCQPFLIIIGMSKAHYLTFVSIKFIAFFLNGKFLLLTLVSKQNKMKHTTHHVTHFGNLNGLTLGSIVLVIIVIINRASGRW